MNLEVSIEKDLPCILVEGPRWADAAFYGKWLLAAAKANALWDKAIKDPSFEKQVNRLMVAYIPEFSISATVLLSYLEKNSRFLGGPSGRRDGSGRVHNDGRNGIFRPHRPTLPDGDPDPVDHREGQKSRAEIGPNGRRGILPPSRVPCRHHAIRRGQSMASASAWYE